ncbi:MAG: PQQ-binding-like beta-propeller repeat protein [Chthoniobacteraceae bacterium]|nr:PQQ-binding-like beta-propeller repeat protein [Chthoniobacteraceae bacterium]
MKRLSTFLFLGLCLLSPAVQAADWPCYRGANQDGISTETLALDWGTAAPKVLWKVPVNTGFSSIAVSGGLAVTQAVREINGAPREICLALDAATGQERWAADVALGKGYDGGGQGDGPRSTPTISDGAVFVLTPDLVLHALNTNDGSALWTHDLVKEYGAVNIHWNSAASPVVDDGLVFVMSGGEGQSLLAFEQKTGKLAWKVESEKITHATPVVATILGERQVIFYCQSGLVSLSVKNGNLLWKFPYKYSTSAAASPVVSGDMVYCSAAYGVGGGVCKITKEASGFKATALWQTPGNTETANHWSTPVCKDGFLYGMYGFRALGNGPLKCVEMATGKVRWAQPGFGQGNVVLASGKLLALADNGDLVVIDPSADAYKELARIKTVQGKCWSTPAISNGHIYVRSTQEAVCLDASVQ